LTQVPSKKDFADWINRLAGMPVMDEKKLDVVLQGAGKAIRTQGLDGLFDYMRRLTGAPVSNEWMREVWGQLLTPQGMAEWSRKLKPDAPKSPEPHPVRLKQGKRKG
jgi:hypothetical protein